MIYSNTFQSAFYLDDRASISQNLSIRNLSDLGAIWNFWPTRWVTYLTLAVNYHFGRLEVFGYHAFNLTVHVGAALLARWLVLLTFRTPALKGHPLSLYGRPAAFFAGLVFLAHPVQTQAVTYIVQRACSLGAFFYLASVGCYVRSRLSQAEGTAAGPYFRVSLLAAILAVFTKEMTITLPLILVLYEIYFFRGKAPMDWKRLWPFLLVAALVPLTMTLTGSVDFVHMKRVIEKSPGISPWHYFLTQLAVLKTYVRLVFLPLNQNLDYDFPVFDSFLKGPVMAGFLLLILLVLTAVRTFKNHRLISFSILWFLIALLPESSFVPIRDVIFEHRLYLPMFGFALFSASAVCQAYFKRSPKLATGAMILMIAGYSAMAYQRNAVWKDEWTLWNDVCKKSPNKARPYNNRGFVSEIRGDFKSARVDFDKAVQLNPNYVSALVNRGFVLGAAGDYEKAVLDYKKVLEISPKNAQAYSNLGLVYAMKGDFEEALRQYDKAIEICPGCAEVYNNRGAAHKATGNIGEALVDYDQALKVNPAYTEVYNNRGNIRSFLGELDKAVSDYNKALLLDPRQAGTYVNRGQAYGVKGELDKALADFDQAIRIKPDYGQAYGDRAVVHFAKQNYGASRQDVETARSLGYEVNPGFLEKLKKVQETGTQPAS